MKCKNCDAEIKFNSRRCLNCGTVIYKSIHIKYICGAIGIFVVLILLITSMGFERRKSNKINDSKVVASASSENNDTTALATDENKDKASLETSEEDSKKQDKKIKYENFLKIKMGESYDDVVALFGEGKESSSKQIDGINATIYKWKESGISEMSVIVQNNVVIEKSQLGLESSDAQITMDKYNQVQDGISYEELKKILGEGQILTESKINDIESSIYEYMNQNGSNASFTFSDGKLAGKLQVDLE